MRKTEERIAVLDGIRACAILIVMGYHFWQQSWLQGVIPADCLRFLGIRDASLAWVPRTGYMAVDVLLLLSAFCLFLPHARRMTDPLSPAPDGIRRFYLKRAARILPPYYLCLLISLVFFIRPADYGSTAAYWKDVLTHFTCTHTFFPDTYFTTKFSTVLWTLGIEVQFYLVFPLLARFFRKRPLCTWFSLQILALLYMHFRVHLPDGGADAFRINQFPAHLGVFANGMLASYLCCVLNRTLPRTRQSALLGTVCSVFFLGALVCMLRHSLLRAAVLQRWQVDYRFWFSLMAAGLFLSLDRAHTAVQWLFSNRAMRFVAGISYNLYLYHATVMLKLKEWRIPWYPDAPENAYAWPQSASYESWQRPWQWKYAAVFWVSALLLAAGLTVLFEQPVYKILTRKRKIKH